MPIGTAPAELGRKGPEIDVVFVAKRFAADPESAVKGADFIQESASENEDLKRRLHARIDAAAPLEVVIASSSSGLLPSRFQADCKHPERVLVGHPNRRAIGYDSGRIGIVAIQEEAAACILAAGQPAGGPGIAGDRMAGLPACCRRRHP